MSCPRRACPREGVGRASTDSLPGLFGRYLITSLLAKFIEYICFDFFPGDKMFFSFFRSHVVKFT